MRLIPLICLVVFIGNGVHAQIVEINSERTAHGFAAGEKEMDLFGRGLLDFGFEGQLQASTQALKINIGEPDKFYLPLYLLVGATNGDFGKDELNKSTVLSLINPTGGTINGSTNFYAKLFASPSGITSLKLTGLLSGKLLSGRNATTNDAELKLAGLFDGGLIFQTGAWEAGGTYQEGGIFWLQFKYSYAALGKQNIKELFGIESDNPQGPRADLGIFIKDRVNIKLSYYKAVAGSDIPTLGNSQFRIGLDYSVKK